MKIRIKRANTPDAHEDFHTYALRDWVFDPLIIIYIQQLRECAK